MAQDSAFKYILEEMTPEYPLYFIAPESFIHPSRIRHIRIKIANWLRELADTIEWRGY